MANKTINELSPVTLSSTSEFAVYQNGSTGKATLQNILSSYLTDDTIYPITKASAVYMEGSTNTVEGMITSLNTDKVSKNGDTMTGNLYIHRDGEDTPRMILRQTDLDTRIGGSTYSSNRYTGQYYMRDKNNISTGWLRNILIANSNLLQTEMYCQRQDLNNTQFYNYLGLGIDNSGNPIVRTTSPKAWKDMLGLPGIKTLTKIGSVSPLYINVPSTISSASNYGIGIIIQFNNVTSGTRLYVFSLAETACEHHLVTGTTATTTLTWESANRRYKFTTDKGGQLLIILGGSLGVSSSVTIE